MNPLDDLPSQLRPWRSGGTVTLLHRDLTAVRFVFSPPAEEAAGLLSLPWAEPLEDWDDERMVEIRQRGIHRHVVRFVADDAGLYALKSISERLARREYQVLRALAELGVPAVEVVGIAVDLGQGEDAILVTKFLTYATTYRAVFSSPRGGGPPADKLLDALVELLARLHMSGFFWGDCSLSNTLFRYDAGALRAYLVDAETSEQHSELSNGQRRFDVELAVERVYGELLDLEAGDLLPADAAIRWSWPRSWSAATKGYGSELTREEVIPLNEQRFRIAERLRRLNELGFAAEEVELISAPDGNRLRVRTRVAEAGDNSSQALHATGIDAGENQARRPAERYRLLPRVPGAEGGPSRVGSRRGQHSGSPRSTIPSSRRSRWTCAGG